MSAVINRVLRAIPMNIENFTRPSLYSFFQGRKYVLTIRGSEKALKKDLLSVEKYLNSEKGASRYQNFRISKGSFNID